jgi:hypothetical protein
VDVPGTVQWQDLPRAAEDDVDIYATVVGREALPFDWAGAGFVFTTALITQRS